jgi:Tfp pilus assembly protein PilF
MNNTLQNSKNKLSRQSEAARVEMERALSFHFQGDKADALKALRKALKLDPSLARETLPSNLAHELIGLPALDALASLMDGNSSQAIIDTA